MTTAATMLFDFLPAEEMFNVAEAVIRVFHAHGDYQHKQRNRMKFLIKAMGWDAWREAFDEAWRTCGRGRTRACRSPIEPAAEEQRSLRRAAMSTAERTTSSRGSTVAPLKGPGIVPVLRRRGSTATTTYTDWRRSNVAAAEAGRVT